MEKPRRRPVKFNNARFIDMLDANVMRELKKEGFSDCFSEMVLVMVEGNGTVSLCTTFNDIDDEYNNEQTIKMLEEALKVQRGEKW